MVLWIFLETLGHDFVSPVTLLKNLNNAGERSLLKKKFFNAIMGVVFVINHT